MDMAINMKEVRDCFVMSKFEQKERGGGREGLREGRKEGEKFTIVFTSGIKQFNKYVIGLKSWLEYNIY